MLVGMGVFVYGLTTIVGSAHFGAALMVASGLWFLVKSASHDN